MRLRICAILAIAATLSSCGPADPDFKIQAVAARGPRGPYYPPPSPDGYYEDDYYDDGANYDGGYYAEDEAYDPAPNDGWIEEEAYENPWDDVQEDDDAWQDDGWDDFDDGWDDGGGWDDDFEDDWDDFDDWA